MVWRIACCLFFPEAIKTTSSASIMVPIPTVKAFSGTCVNGYPYNQTTGACDVVYYSCEEAELGDIYYSDNTCTRNGVCGTKTIIG